jgi:hypothetical protein
LSRSVIALETKAGLVPSEALAPQLGNAVGLGVVASVVAASAASWSDNHSAATDALVAGLPAGLLVCAGFAAAALIVVLGALQSQPSS